MTNFIGAEYIIATILTEQIKRGKSYVSLNDLCECGICAQNMANSQEIDVIFLNSKVQLINTIYNYSDYFKCVFNNNGDINGVILDYSKDINDLEYHFIVYLPQNIFDILVEVAKNIK